MPGFAALGAVLLDACGSASMLTTGGSLDALALAVDDGGNGRAADADGRDDAADCLPDAPPLPRATSATTMNTSPTAASAPPAPTASAHVGFFVGDAPVAHGALKPAGG